MNIQKTALSRYVFEKMETTSFNRKGEKVTYERTARVDKKAPVKEITALLNALAVKYLIHRVFVVTDKIFWQRFQSEYPYSILTLDYSENIEFKPKMGA